MSQPLPGQVQLAGLYEGPASAWCPTAEQLSDALGRAGAPTDSLQAVVDGGQASLEASPTLYPRGQFSSDPGDALGMALELLISESLGERPAGWFSTLRVTEYRDQSLRESLIQVGAEGVRVVGRDSDWVPAPAEKRRTRLLRQWKIGVLLLVAAVALGVKERDRVSEVLRGLQGVVLGRSLEIPQDFAADAGAFAPWIRFAELRVDGDLLRVRLEATEAYPADAAALDLLRGQVELEARAALNAIENGRARLRGRVEEGLELPETEFSLAPLQRGEAVEVVIAVGPLAATTLESLELTS